jgi:hypothetical protein
MWKTIVSTVLFFYYIHVGYLSQSILPYPKINESFSAEIHLIFQNFPGQYTTTGEGHVGRDYANLTNQVINLQILKFGEYQATYYQLKRFDLRQTFTIVEGFRHDKYCFKQFLFSFEKVWGWLKFAKYMGLVKINGNYFEEWNSTDNKLSILVNQTHRRIPVRYIALTDDNLTIVDFKLFRRRAPAPEEFDVPKLCLSTPLPSPDDEDEAKDY